MEERVKERLIGAAVLASLAIIFLPMLVGPSEQRLTVVSPLPGELGARIIPLEEPPPTQPDEVRVGRHGGPASSASEADSALRVPMPAASEAPSGIEDAVRTRATTQRTKATVIEARSPVERGAWVVQLASFSEAENAIALRDRLRASGYPAFTESTHTQRGSVIRVYVGPERDQAQVRESVEALERETQLKGIVVRYSGG